MYRPRIIPVLLLQAGGLVKSVSFKKHRYIGDPINAVKIFNDLKADELVFLDIDASREGRTIDPRLVQEIGEEANMPFSVGGGISSVAQIRALIQAGAERVVIGSASVADPDFIKRAAVEFGTSTISVCMDVKKNFWGKESVWTKNGRELHKIDPVAFAKQMELLGAGELIVQSIEQDGLMKGFDKDLIKRVSDNVSIPIVALGGAGSIQHFKELYQFIPTSGIASGSKFVYQNEMKAVLINYPVSNEKTFIYE